MKAMAKTYSALSVLLLAATLVGCNTTNTNQPDVTSTEPSKTEPSKTEPSPDLSQTGLKTKPVPTDPPQTVTDSIEPESLPANDATPIDELVPSDSDKIVVLPDAEDGEPSVSTDIQQKVVDTSEVTAQQAKETSEPATTSDPEAKSPESQLAVEALCEAIGNKLGSVSVQDCKDQPLRHAGYSTKGMSLAYREYLPDETRPALGKILVLGGIHGDEFSSVSIIFKWLRKLDQHHSGLFHWRIVPSVNPDGLLQRKSQRQNSNGVDLNRNFPTQDWDSDAMTYWIEEAHRNARRYPGPKAASEIETQWVIAQINDFNPDVVISMHAPYHLVDYDGPPSAPESLGSLYLRKLGVYPGSLGNYVGVDMGKPIVTVELKSAGIMPSKREIDVMWSDLVQWLKGQLRQD